ncbi:MAG: FtsX-like permease family protein [Luteitalea sp.]|nr:FtsX-like permease family protein [Luteitalea sp.]
MRVSALNRKLLRDLVAMKGQATAIALVIAAGMTMFVTFLSNFDSLRRTQQAYYERQRFADVFASLKRAPEQLAARIAAIPGVAQVETRVVANVVLDVPGVDEPASGRLVAVPASQRPALNDLHMRAGTWVSASRPDEVIASGAFCDANGFRVGDQVSAIINGRKRRLTIAGIALSPEYVYSIRPGEIIPDARRFGVFWMERRALASAFDMEGGFNDVALKLDRGALIDDVIAQLDRLLTPYGGIGAIPRARQFSNWTLNSELAQLESQGFVIPLLFLFVAAFVLNVALTRALALQRPQLAALKALGYTNLQLGWHYLKWALAIALAGALLGIIAGAWLGSGLAQLYTQYFAFPILLYGISFNVILGALAIALGAAAAGAFSAVRRSVRIPPAEAMRPEPPARYRQSVIETPWLRRHVPTGMRMVLRNIERQPVRAAASVIGIAFAGGILQIGVGMADAMQELILMQFSVAERQHVTLNFVEPASSDAIYAISRLPGVISVEPQRSVPARLRATYRYRDLAISGLPAAAQLKRIVNSRGRAVTPPSEGLVLSSVLAEILDVTPGDDVTVEVFEGNRPVRQIRVAGVVDDTLGMFAYMEIEALHRLMREGATLSGAALLIDPARERELSARLKELPAVAGVASKRVVVENFRETLAENMNIQITLNVLFAGIIAFGVVYNAARVSLSERSRELASLRVLGFTRAEISLILLGELAVLTLLALPVGAALGYGLLALIALSIEAELFRLPLRVTPQVMAWTALTIIIASFVSGLVVRRQLDRLDLVGVLKTRE